MTRTEFLVVPQDTSYFGEARSLPAGETHHGRSLFPPPTSTWQGMVRTRLLADSGVDLRNRSERQRAIIEGLVGSPDALPSGWTLEAPVPVQPTEDGAALEGWFPTPLFLHRPAHAAAKVPPRPLRLNPLPTTAYEGIFSDMGSAAEAGPDLVPVGAPKAGRTAPYGGWLSATDLLAVLRGGHPAPLPEKAWEWRRSRWDLPPFLSWETRPGLALNPDYGTARESMLYFLETLRFQPECGMLGVLEADLSPPLRADALQRDMVYVGRKARPHLLFQPPPAVRAWQEIRAGSYLPPSVRDRACFWLYLASAVYLPNPVMPSLSASGGVEIQVQAALLHKPIWQGGFSLVTRRARPSRAMVPAGSAWLISVSGGSDIARAEAIRSLHNRSPWADPVRAAFGEGRTLVGLLEPRDGGRP